MRRVENKFGIIHRGIHADRTGFGTQVLQIVQVLNSWPVRSMGLRRDDLRPLLQLLRRELAHEHGGYSRRFPLAELSLEGNELDEQFPAAISNALRELSPPVGMRWPYPGQGYEPEVRAEVRQPRARALRKSESLPDLASPGSSDMPERDALSEGDMEESQEFSSLNLRSRRETVQQFREELKILSAMLEARGVRGSAAHHSQRASNPQSAAQPQVHRQTFTEPIARAPQARGFGPIRQTLAENISSLSGDEGIAVGAIPDMGMACGFGPPVPPGTYSYTESTDGSEVPGESAPAESRTGLQLPPSSDPQRHAKMQVLRNVISEGRHTDIPMDQMMRFALDLVSSDTSLNALAELPDRMDRDGLDERSSSQPFPLHGEQGSSHSEGDRPRRSRSV